MNLPDAFRARPVTSVALSLFIAHVLVLLATAVGALDDDIAALTLLLPLVAVEVVGIKIDINILSLSNSDVGKMLAIAVLWWSGIYVFTAYFVTKFYRLFRRSKMFAKNHASVQ